MTFRLLFFLSFLAFISCRPMKQKADLILYNGNIQTVDENLTLVQAMAVKDGKIIGTGSIEYIFQHFHSDSNTDLQGKFVYPGFIDSHCHFYGYAITVKTMADLSSAASPEEMIEILKKFRKDHPLPWLAGRGWDQNKWARKEFPDKALLDKEFPGVPVVLIRIDGHAVLVNQVAINQLDMTEENLDKKGEAKFSKGKFTGIFFENTADSFKDALPSPSTEMLSKFLIEAEQDCFSYGLTTVADAGLSRERVLLLDSLQRDNLLKLRVYAMLDPSDENIEYFVKKGVFQTDKLTVRAIKLYADGALGSRGGCLLQPYTDDPSNFGLLLISPEKLREYCTLALVYGYQVNTHAIGDSANRTVLKIYGEFLKTTNDKRWRIEHAQVVDPSDFQLFGKYSVIPAIQSTHATSDMYWAEKRLGAGRLKNAYAYKSLLEQNGWLPNGTDFPIEKINPLLSFYAAVARKDIMDWPADGFQLENAITRAEALRSITIWAARACFEERLKGSLENGKVADFVILDHDLMTVPLTQIPGIQVLETYLDGNKVFDRKKMN